MGRAALNGSPNMEDIRISKTRIRVAQNKTVYQTLLNWQQYYIISTKFKQFIICLRLWDRRRYFCRYDWRVLCQRTLSLAKSYLASWYCSQLKGQYAELISQGMKRWYPWVWRVDILGMKSRSLGMKRSGNEGTMGKHEKTLRGGEEPPKKLPLVVLTAPQPLSTSSSPPTLQFKQKFGELWIDLITSVWTVYSTSAVSFK